MNGGECIARILTQQQVPFLFTLCGGHISPILVECKKQGIRVIDVRDEANAVFAADAVARLTGVPGVVAVTAGPGVTNTLTAIKNAQMAQSPVIILAGATATILKNRGSLQDIDQLSLVRSLVKWAISVKTLRHLAHALEQAFQIALDKVPGPVFLECPVDLLYEEALVREWYWKETGLHQPRGFGQKLVKLYLERHLKRQFQGSQKIVFASRFGPTSAVVPTNTISKTLEYLKNATRPLVVLGSQSVLSAHAVSQIAEAVKKLGVPTYLAGMARGLLGAEHPLQFRHQRNLALKNADLVLVLGFPFDFRLGYGRSISSKAKVIAVNRSFRELKKNRRPTLGICTDAGAFLIQLAQQYSSLENPERWEEWFQTLYGHEKKREEEIDAKAKAPTEGINPVKLFQVLESHLSPQSVLVADGGDFVATASYILRPRSPLSWLDPGVFGTLGVGAGFALGARLCRPSTEVWILYGDGSAGYTLSEFDTFVRHQIPVIAIVGNDGSWAQIAREQKEILKDEVGTVLRRSDYHRVVEGFGAKGLLLQAPEEIESTFEEAKKLARAGYPVLINAMIGTTDFRKGSISM